MLKDTSSYANRLIKRETNWSSGYFDTGSAYASYSPIPKNARIAKLVLTYIVSETERTRREVILNLAENKTSTNPLLVTTYDDTTRMTFATFFERNVQSTELDILVMRLDAGSGLNMLGGSYIEFYS